MISFVVGEGPREDDGVSKGKSRLLVAVAILCRLRIPYPRSLSRQTRPFWCIFAPKRALVTVSMARLFLASMSFCVCSPWYQRAEISCGALGGGVRDRVKQ